MKSKLFRRGLAFVWMLAFPAGAAAQEGGALSPALSAWFMEGRPYAELRARYEFVEDDLFARNAHSTTLRTRLGFETGTYAGLNALVEVEDVSPLGGERFNSGINGKTNYPLVADPDVTELNQLYVRLSAIDSTQVTLGRQYILEDNGRFIGTVGWRQNSQTQDAIVLRNWSVPDGEIFYAYGQKVNRVLSDKHPMGDYDGQMHMASFTYKPLRIGVLRAYSYLFDVDNVPVVASNSFGASLDGEQFINDDYSFLYRAEYAVQTDTGRNPNDYRADYSILSAGVAGSWWSLRLAVETLGSDNGIGFATPLSTLHEFNGWADLFLATPPLGLEDKHAKLDLALDSFHPWLEGTNFAARYHQFASDVGGVDYGHELDFDLTKKWDERYEVGLRFAHYEADQFAADKQLAVLTLRYHYGE